MEQKIDEKLVGKIHKLLALARDGGATEGEANSAMEMAQKIMLANNLSMAIIEQSGGAVEGKRVKDTTSGVVMEDYAEAEADLNRDLRMGWEPGRSARQRAESNVRQAAIEVKLQERVDAAWAAGASEREVSTMRIYDCTLEEARETIAKIDAPDNRTDAQRRKAEEKARKENERWARSEETRRRRERNRLDFRGYVAGQRAADHIGLDKQVSRSEQGKLK